MLRLITGKARTGKTALVYREIKQAVQEKRKGSILIVPEQYSHEAERELCTVCGDTLSLYAEVLSFTGLARKISSELGGIAVTYLDDGGRTLCMAQAMKLIGGKLEVFRSASAKPELQQMLIAAVDGMKASSVTSGDLSQAALRCEGDLARKLSDLAAISEAYDAVLGNSRVDPGDRLAALAENIAGSAIMEKSMVYVDGFIDFTRTELSVLTAMLKKGVQLTVCLTTDREKAGSEIFALSKSSAGKLRAIAEELGVKVETIHREEEQSADPLRLLTEYAFSYTGQTFAPEGKIELCRAESMAAECELAADKVLKLVRETGCRWRDIAIAVRGYEDYAPLLENTFEDYGIPLFTARRTDLKSRPIPALIACAYAIVNGGWKYDDVISYMGTGLTGLTREECDQLSDYLYIWKIDERAWRRKMPWAQPPEGYGKEADENAAEKLAVINTLRAKLAEPLLRFAEEVRTASSAAGQAQALAGFLERLNLSGQLERKAERLWNDGRRRESEEYSQLWEIVVSALEQAVQVLGDTRMDSEEFARLFLLTISKYDVGSIPVTLDAVGAGDFDRMRRRNIRNLIILGANDARLPSAGTEVGLFSDDELRLLHRNGTELGGDPDLEMWREYTLLYSCLSLPTDKLILAYPAIDADGNETRPSFLLTRAERLFQMKIQSVNREETELSAPRPAFRLAVGGKGKAAKAAEAYFMRQNPALLTRVRSAAETLRRPISHESVEMLYGKRMRISASRAETFFSCKYSFFCGHGLKIRPAGQAEFSPAEFGTFVHDVLQHTIETIMEEAGFAGTDDRQAEAVARHYVKIYEESVLRNFAEKNERFIYLFKRAEEDAIRTVLDTVAELRKTKFVPLAFELNFGDSRVFPGIRLQNGKDTLMLTGIADRVDGWEHNGKVYIRVIDYKTGEKKFSFSDLWYGTSLQLVLYLLALESNPHAAEKALQISEETELCPAGAVYQHAKSKYLSLDRMEEEETIQKERNKNLRRSGIVLGSDDVPEAWETGEEKIYSPVKTNKKGEPVGEGLISPEQLDLLIRHIRKLLDDMSSQVRSGAIQADPYRVGNGEICCRLCSLNGTCGFEDGVNGETCRILGEWNKDAVLEAMEKEVSEDE